jgi:hypothetical protein
MSRIDFNQEFQSLYDMCYDILKGSKTEEQVLHGCYAEDYKKLAFQQATALLTAKAQYHSAENLNDLLRNFLKSVSINVNLESEK